MGRQRGRSLPHEHEEEAGGGHQRSSAGRRQHPQHGDDWGDTAIVIGGRTETGRQAAEDTSKDQLLREAVAPVPERPSQVLPVAAARPASLCWFRPRTSPPQGFP